MSRTVRLGYCREVQAENAAMRCARVWSNRTMAPEAFDNGSKCPTVSLSADRQLREN